MNEKQKELQEANRLAEGFLADREMEELSARGDYKEEGKQLSVELETGPIEVVGMDPKDWTIKQDGDFLTVITIERPSGKIILNPDVPQELRDKALQKLGKEFMRMRDELHRRGAL